MKPTIYPNLKFFEYALETNRNRLRSLMAEAVCESRTAADDDVQLTADGLSGLHRLIDMMNLLCFSYGLDVEWSATVLDANVLAESLVHFNSLLFRYPLVGPIGLAIYAELICMMESLMVGVWFE